ncbi:MAG: hypothetical protein ACLUEK_02330 [Oscillospiraceae bacterium]
MSVKARPARRSRSAVGSRVTRRLAKEFGRRYSGLPRRAFTQQLMELTGGKRSTASSAGGSPPSSTTP